MSGLAAVFEFAEPTRAAPARDAILGGIAYRGFDGLTRLDLGPVALGHARNATTPHGAPGLAQRGGAAAAFDGRLDDRGTLARRVGLPEHAADVELVLAAYERFGVGFATHLVGDFAFVVADPAAGRCLLGRDAPGVRPLFYHRAAGRVIAASDAPALHADGRLRARPDLRSVARFAAADYEESGATLYADVQAVPPGSTIEIREGLCLEHVHYAPDPFVPVRFAREEEYALAFREVLDRAVADRLAGPGPFGLDASGGLDSTSVIGVAERLRRRGRIARATPWLVSRRYPGLSTDESLYADAVAAHWDLPTLRLEPLRYPERHRADPRAIPPGVVYEPISCDRAEDVARLRQHGVRVSLSGAGSEESLHLMGSEARTFAEERDFGRLLQRVVRDDRPGYLLAHALITANTPRVLRRLGRRLRPPGDGAPAWLLEPYRTLVGDAMRDAALAYRRRPFPNEVTRAMASDFMRLPAWFLTNVDRIAAREGGEVRYPFYDRRVFQFALNVPERIRTGSERDRPLLRAAMAGDLPPLIAARDANAPGYSVGNGFYLRAVWDDQRAEVRRLLARSILAEVGIVRSSDLARMAANPEANLVTLTLLLGAELWLRSLAP